jgi:hypothetical protein
MVSDQNRVESTRIVKVQALIGNRAIHAGRVYATVGRRDDGHTFELPGEIEPIRVLLHMIGYFLQNG